VREPRRMKIFRGSRGLGGLWGLGGGDREASGFGSESGKLRPAVLVAPGLVWVVEVTPNERLVLVEMVPENLERGIWVVSGLPPPSPPSHTFSPPSSPPSNSSSSSSWRGVVLWNLRRLGLSPVA
jgi:hypothetical protein